MACWTYISQYTILLSQTKTAAAMDPTQAGQTPEYGSESGNIFYLSRVNVVISAHTTAKPAPATETNVELKASTPTISSNNKFC